MTYRFAWDIIMALVYLYVFVAIPYTMAFNRLPKNGLDIVVENLIILSPGYVICLIDIFLNLITGFISRDGHEIFLDPLLILKLVTISKLLDISMFLQFTNNNFQR